MSNRKVRAAVVGAGTVSESHLSALRDHPQAALTGIVDLDESRAQAAAEKYETTPFYDIEALLEKDVDLIHICTSVQSHFSLAKQVIESGTAVLIEKPLTETVEQAERLIELADEHGVKASVVHQHLFSPAMLSARQKIRAGALGEIRSVNLLYLGETPPDMANRGTWVFDLPGGEFEEGLPHPLYMTLGVGGYPNDKSAIKATTSLVGDYEEDFTYDNAQVQYVTDSGTLCSVLMTSSGHVQRLLHIQGDRGSILVDEETQSVVPMLRDYSKSPLSKARKNVDISAGLLQELGSNAKLMIESQINDDWESRSSRTPHLYEIDLMVKAVAEDTAVPVPLEEGKWTLALMQAIRDESTRQDAPRTTV